jgi:hypothetical protein
MSHTNSYGIIALIRYPGARDEAHFDGWYTYLSDARGMLELFAKRYPEADIFIVTPTKHGIFRDLEVHLGERERDLINQQHDARCRRTGT